MPAGRCRSVGTRRGAGDAALGAAVGLGVGEGAVGGEGAPGECGGRRDGEQHESGAPGTHYCCGRPRVRICEIHAEEILKTRRTLTEVISKHTGQPLEQIERDTDRDKFMDPHQAKIDFI